MNFLDGIPTMTGSLTVPPCWCWTAEVTLSSVEIASKFKVGQSVVLSVDGIERRGTVRVTGDPDLRNGVRLVGGANKLSTMLEPRDYRGQTLDLVVADALRDAGEQVGDLTAYKSTNLAHWSRARAPAGYCLTRLARLAPDVFLRVGTDGAWTAVRPTWKNLGAYDDWRAEAFPAERAVMINVIGSNTPEPGTAITFLDTEFRVDRVKSSWLLNTHQALLWEWDPTSPLDRLHAPQQIVQRNLRAEDMVFDFAVPARGRLAKAGGDGGLVDVFVDDPFNRLTTLVDVPLYSPTGEVVKLGIGTKVRVGWLFSDERFPYAVVDTGDLTWSERTFTDHYSLVGPDIRLGSNVALELDDVATKRDLQTLMWALQQAVTVPNDGGANFKSTLLIALGSALWTSQISDQKFCVSGVRVKR